VKDLGGFEVRRLLPAFPHKMLGPFILFDHIGPARFAPGQDVARALAQAALPAGARRERVHLVPGE